MKKLLHYTEILKHLPRTGWLRKNISHPESVAAHSWQMAMMALYLSEQETQDYDFNKVIRLCLCHDLAESIIGDITPVEEKYASKPQKEAAAMQYLAADVGSKEILNLFAEYEEAITPEAKLARDLDQLDMYIQSLDYEQKYGGNLEEFRLSAIEKIKTKLGDKLLKELKESKIRHC